MKWVRGPGGYQHAQVGDSENVIGALLRFRCGATWRVDRATPWGTIRCPGCEAALDRAERRWSR